MLFRETRETEDDIRRMFCEAIERMKNMITLKKKSGPGKFAIPCTRILGGIVRDLEVHIGNVLVPVDFHVLDIKLNWNSSMLFGRAFLSTVGAVCNMQTNQLCLTLIDPMFTTIIFHATSIDSSNKKSIDIPKEESIDSSPGDWENDYYNPTLAAHTRDTIHTEEYDEDYEEERAIEYKAILDEEDRILHHSSWKRNAPSIDRTVSTSIDTHPYQTSRQRASTDIAYYPSIVTRVDRPREGDYSIGSWADDHHHESYAVETAIHEPGAYNLFMQQCNSPAHQQMVTNEIINIAGGVADRLKKKSQQHTRLSINVDVPSSIDRLLKFGKRAYDSARRFHWEEKDEYRVYKDDQGHAIDVDRHIIGVSKDDIISLLERASRDEHSYLCLPEHTRLFTQTKLVPEIYTKNEINEMFYGVCGAQ
ncbi:hypothetical protein IGI04_029964 [Brassica rapa subsp. trilocularis]|uniref:DUF4283 domain-containing protein n=1 Tax=Brassica rapa subsp. trilocularis TaxID=1813537 RepID=A0ABQ7LS41_BRACM|nr:hypothetical protein IGI04_029964 [Brassica rapa subsp. trilocularis]